jgi:hypothetical protein
VVADYGLFVGWGQVPRGREKKALIEFNDAIQYYAGLQQKGDIEGFEPVILEAHGGDLLGFVLIRGTREKLARLRVDQEFERRLIRAGLIVDNLGVVGALVGQGVTEGLVTYQEQLSELT